MAPKADKDLTRDQAPVPTLNALAPTFSAPAAHPPVVVPAGAFPELENPPVLGFAPAPAVSAEPAVQTDTPIPAPGPRPRGRLRFSWYEAAIIALILACGALCVYRLFWAISL